MLAPVNTASRRLRRWPAASVDLRPAATFSCPGSDKVSLHIRQTTQHREARWLHMNPTGFEAVKGNRFTYRTTPAGAWDGTIQCEVLEVIPNERLAYAWRGGDEANSGYGSKLDTVVTFTLSKAANGTRLRLVHSGFVLPKNETAFTNMSGGWKKVVGNIGAISGE